MNTTTKTEVRPLHTIATEIIKEWQPKMYFGATPYVMAMLKLSNISDTYGFDSGRSMVAYFLANAQTWKGEAARRVKKELNAMIK